MDSMDSNGPSPDKQGKNRVLCFGIALKPLYWREIGVLVLRLTGEKVRLQPHGLSIFVLTRCDLQTHFLADRSADESSTWRACQPVTFIRFSSVAPSWAPSSRESQRSCYPRDYWRVRGEQPKVACLRIRVLECVPDPINPRLPVGEFMNRFYSRHFVPNLDQPLACPLGGQLR